MSAEPNLLDLSFLERHPKIAAGPIVSEDNLGAMLIEILELYGIHFNFDKVGLAIDNGGSYLEKQEMLDISVNANVWKTICIRDPNDRNNNIAKATHQVDNVISVFGEVFRIDETMLLGTCEDWGGGGRAVGNEDWEFTGCDY